MLTTMLDNLAWVAGMHSGVWLLSLIRRDASVVDLFWGVGFVVIAARSIIAADSATPLGWLLVAIVTLWAFRLSGYLVWRNWNQPEDRRYASMRQHWGGWFPVVSLFTIFFLQALLTWIVALPVQTGILNGGELGLVAWVGSAVWLIGVLFESFGDYQLARFKSDPANQGKVLDSGLWRYTRHPNYFGDFMVWWGVYLAANSSAFVWWSIVGPLVMSVLLMRVSGVTLLESSLRTRKEGYDDYVQRTNAFFPWFPR